MTRFAWVALALLGAALGAAPAAPAQPLDPRGPVFRIEEEPEERRGVVAGWVYNDGHHVVGLIRLRLELLDGAGAVASTHHGWAYGNARPGGRAYFRITIPPDATGPRRIAVESFAVQAVQSP